MTQKRTTQDFLYEDTIPGGAHWSMLIRKGTTLRLIDQQGGANLAMLMYNPIEKLESYKNYKCKKTENSNQIVLLNTPKYLLVTLKRFNFNYQLNRFTKNTKPIDFPVYLHFKNYLLQNNENKKVNNLDLYKRFLEEQQAEIEKKIAEAEAQREAEKIQQALEKHQAGFIRRRIVPTKIT